MAPFAGPVDRVVDAVMAGVRLEGWALWCQLCAIAELLTAWATHPPLDPADPAEPPGTGSSEPQELSHVDGPLARRLTRAGRAARSGADRYDLSQYTERSPDQVRADALAEAEIFATAEVAASCGLSGFAAGKRVAAARLLLVEQRLPRVAMLLRAGLLDRAKTELLVARLGELDVVVAACVEERLIPSHDVPVLPDLPHAPDLTDPDLLEAGRGQTGPWAELDVRADPAAPGAVLPVVTRMTLPGLRQAIDDALAAIDPDALAERAR
ncbi:MAG TPA: hypothetical protein VE781_14225, partial [Kineosporiaceae bacterium]|nr:hypothetical protein [Kineosporiaceae bacterium]